MLITTRQGASVVLVPVCICAPGNIHILFALLCTSGPSLNILIKLMSIVAVVLAGTGKLSETGLL
jgi:hypothetical protein